MSERRRVEARHVRAVRVGHGANCSSVGSVVDTLFATAVVGGALLAAIAAALSREPIRVVGQRVPPEEPEPREPSEPPDEEAPT